MAKRWGWLALALVVATGGAAGAAEHRATPAKPGAPDNPVNARLLKMKPADRAALLAKAVGHWCIGTEAFPMGVSKTGSGAGDAYWSLRCADGSAWAVQIDRYAQVTAVDCAAFDALGEGKKCFKRF
jgi:hypothetical protein